MTDSPATQTENVVQPIVHTRPWYQVDDFLAMGIAFLIIIAAAAVSLLNRPADSAQLIEQHQQKSAMLKELDRSAEDYKTQKEQLSKDLASLEKKLAPMPLASWLIRPGEWKSNPADAFVVKGKPIPMSLLAVGGALLILFTLVAVLQGNSPQLFPMGFAGVFLMVLASYVLAGQEVIKHYNLEYALWAVLLGLVISNTVGTPKWLATAIRPEFYVKTGLVLLGGEVLFNKLMALGPPGIFISWIVTPVVLITTYLFGQYVLRIPSKSLNLVISADMSVCGVSAAVATAAACRARKEELSLAIGLSLIFTVISMVIQPFIIAQSGMGEVVGGAWLGGTIDSTGAVAAAGAMVGPVAKDVAATIKMIQNILIGVVAFAVAVYWVSFVEAREDGKRPSIMEIWWRFPKFTLGFLAVSMALSWLAAQGLSGRLLVGSIVDGTTKPLREWLFCLTFVSIGLDSNFREYSAMLKSGKPVVLYICGQSLNLLLSFLMSWLVFTQIYPNAAKELLGK